MTNHKHYKRSTPVVPPPVRPAGGDYNPNWRQEGPTAQVLAMPPREPKAPPPKLKVNARPVRDLRALIERVGRHRVERQLNVHRTTVSRWLEGQVKIPGRQHLAIKMLLGDLPGTDGEWSGWWFSDGLLISPGGDKFSAGQVLSLIFLRSQVTSREREITALKVQLAMTEQSLAQNPGAAANESRAAG